MENSLSNTPEADTLTPDEKSVFADACKAVTAMKKTFEMWMVIGKSVVVARAIADRLDDRKAFMRVIEQQGLGAFVDKSTASRLERIMARLPEITAWREKLTEGERFAWASPTAILKHCPIFKKPTSPKLSPMARLKEEYDQLQQANITLQEALHKYETAKITHWQPEDPVHTIAITLIDMLTTQKAIQVARKILETGDARRSTKVKPAKARRRA